MFLEEYKYVVKEKKMPEYITDDIEISSDSDREDSDEENSDDENLVKNSFYDFFFLYIIMANKYYQKHKKRLRQEARERYQNSTEEEIGKKCQYYQGRKQKLPEYKKIII